MKEIGILLKEARENKGLEVEDAARELKIRPYYIEVLESGDVSSVSSEIYLVGYLKSYCNLLGISSNEVVAKLKSDNDKVLTTTKISNDSTSYYGFDDEIIRPNAAVVFASLFMAVFTYVFWHKENNIMVEPIFDISIESEMSSMLNKNWAENLFKKGTKFLLVAQDTVTLRIKEADGDAISKLLEPGDIYFLSSDKDQVLEIDNPDAIDVFYDDDKSSFVGTLSEIPDEQASTPVEEVAPEPQPEVNTSN
ncbi:MAG: transcriptional regulator, family [Rickettsiaceae bacterium]|jgi:transcriptional regulator with XRE-family HTH domain|nr:transcriptional regulator, family [Rickettsiaceae bacterium]